MSSEQDEDSGGGIDLETIARDWRACAFQCLSLPNRSAALRDGRTPLRDATNNHIFVSLDPSSIRATVHIRLVLSDRGNEPRRPSSRRNCR